MKHKDKYPGFHIVPASEWVLIPPKQREMLINLGGVPVNDHFLQVWDRPHSTKRQIDLLYGTYGSSKTVDRIQEHLLECLHDSYFKCYYGRNVFELCKKEFHSSIVSTLKRMGLEDKFEFSEKPNGSKVIRCLVNGNKFIPFGCDDEESLKGWDDATHVFIDEMNQISFKIFGMAQSRLRKQGAKKKLTGCFNNCDVFEDHWIRTILLNPEGRMLDDNGKPIDRNIFEHFSLYTHNYFIDHDDYKNALIEQAGGDPVRQSAILNGEWGARTTGQPFYKNFNPRVHVSPCSYNPSLPLHISWDENLNPYLPVGIFQLSGTDIRMIDEIAAVNPYNTLQWVCSEIIRRYGPGGHDHKGGMYIYGDASSRKGDVKTEQGKDMYKLLKEYLDYFKPKLRVGNINPNVAMRGNFMNAVLGANFGMLCIQIDPRCKNAISDFRHTSEAPDGSKDKSKTTVNDVKGVQRYGHFTDLTDYLVCYAYLKEFNKFQNGGKIPTWRGKKRAPHNYF